MSQQVEPIYGRLGKRLRRARRKVGVTQLELAEHMGLSRTSIANIEAGRQRVFLHQLVAGARALAVPYRELL